MHYPWNAFAKDSNFPTIVPKQKHARIGQSKNLSPLDVVKIQFAYKCDIAGPIYIAENYGSKGVKEVTENTIESPEDTTARRTSERRKTRKIRTTTITTAGNNQ